jgi:Kef-type K+ transport system membrane component KefB
MQGTTQFLLTLGVILLLGLFTSELGRRTSLPRVTLLLLFGVLIGKDALDIIPSIFSDRFEIIANMALLMVGFLLGGKLTTNTFNNSARKIFWISISAALVTTLIVSFGLILIGAPLPIAILLGCLASATAPAAVLDVVLESDDKGPFGKLLLSIVALDDAWALILFATGLSIVSSLNGHNVASPAILMILQELGGAVLLGVIIGAPAAYLTGRIKPGQPSLTEALGIVFLCGGLALWLDVSFLIAAMTMGAVIANFAKHHEYPFHAIEGIEWPFMVIFFVLAGASLEFSALSSIGLIGVVYILCRLMGKYYGSMLGSIFGNADAATKKWMPIALFPQAGVAIGMALVASTHFPEYRQILLPVIISSKVVFEIIGPVFTRLALKRASKT